MPRSAPQKVLSVAILALVAGVQGATFALQVGVPAPIWIAYAVALGVSLPAWGAFCDRFGSKRVMLYSLALTVLVALFGYAQLFNYRISQAFCFAVFGGLVSAGLPMGLTYSLNLQRDGISRPALGAVAAGFFCGVFLMAVVRLSAFATTYQKALSTTASAVLLLSLAAFASVAFLLPKTRPTSVHFTGLNALQKLWHGFSESDRAEFASRWKALLALSLLASGAVMNGIPALMYSANPAAGPVAPMRCYFVGFGAAAIFSVVVSLILRFRPAAERKLVIVSAALVLLSAIAALLSGGMTSTAVFLPVILGGAALGSMLTLSLVRFAEVARARSGGAEMGAISAIGLLSFIVGYLIALAGIEFGLYFPFWSALIASAIALFLAFPATQTRANG